MERTPDDIHSAIADLARSVAEEMMPLAVALGLHLRVEVAGRNPGELELGATISGPPDIYDVVEDIVVRDGALIASEQDIRDWLHGQIAEMLAEATRPGGPARP